MRFQGLLKSDSPVAAAGSARLSLMEKVSRLMEEATQAGLTETGDLEGPFARVKLLAGQFTVTGTERAQPPSQGASYAMFDVDSILDAILWTKCFLQVLGEGEFEIHPLCAA